MTPDFPAELRDELLDDFYAECDELLGNVRTHLTQLEAACRNGSTDPAALEALYRSAHSFKGISAIVGLRAAEHLAHAAEGLLRSLSRAETPLTPIAIDLLAASTQRLEQIVAAHRLRQPLPNADTLVAELNAHDTGKKIASPRPSESTRASSPETGDSAVEPVASPTPGASAEALMWRASFSPSAGLDQRGVNINSVRTRLAALGEIASAVPSIQAGGKMSFEFVLALREVPADLDAWEADGISLHALEPTSTPKFTAPDAPADTGGGGANSSMFISPSHIVRVDLSRLDDLMRIVGEMVIHRSRLDERIARTAGDRSELQEVNLALGRSLRELREAITRVRLVPVAEIFARLPFVVRDLSREMGKKVRLVLEGQGTEIDKYLVERLKEPLLHLVRNAISHGIESAAERSRAGKFEEATLVLRAASSGQSVVIQIRDDGRGIDAKQVMTRATAAGIPLSQTPTSSELLDVICRPGFSTRDEADHVAGRGVGMAVVHTTVRDLGGSLSLETELGQWTQFTLRLPLTLSIAETFLVSAGDQICAVPQAFVEEVVQFSEAQVRTIQDAEVIAYRDGILPLIRLRKMFGAAPSTATQLPVLVLGSERGLCGLVVDKIHGQREVVVRAMHDPLIQVPGVSGATELGDGRPVLILDPLALSSGAIRPRSHGADHLRRIAAPDRAAHG